MLLLSVVRHSLSKFRCERVATNDDSCLVIIRIFSLAFLHIVAFVVLQVFVLFNRSLVRICFLESLILSSVTLLPPESSNYFLLPPPTCSSPPTCSHLLPPAPSSHLLPPPYLLPPPHLLLPTLTSLLPPSCSLLLSCSCSLLPPHSSLLPPALPSCYLFPPPQT